MRPGDLLEQRYRLVRVLGRGRSGTVWSARNELIDRAVAVKVLHRELATDPERLQRFFQEARACGRVRHPHVVEVLDLGQGDTGILFLVMELLDGETLSALLARSGALAIDEALAIIVPLARGLSAAHEHGILHRDLKPANVFLHRTSTGVMQPKILDFGISKILGSDLTTETGVVLGTPSYMSPEQARGVPDLDGRSDVWALGVMLYECLTGQLPFVAGEYRALMREILERRHTPVEIVRPEVPLVLARILDDMLEKSRERRVASASGAALRLTGVLESMGRGHLARFEVGASGAAPAEMSPKPTSNPPKTTPGVGLTPTALPAARSVAAAIVAQTRGAKRTEAIVERPAAGAVAKGEVFDPRDKEPPSAQEDHTDVELPRPFSTHGWEVDAAKEAASRVATAELAAREAPPMDDNWDTAGAGVIAATTASDPRQGGEKPLTAGSPNRLGDIGGGVSTTVPFGVGDPAAPTGPVLKLPKNGVGPSLSQLARSAARGIAAIPGLSVRGQAAAPRIPPNGRLPDRGNDQPVSTLSGVTGASARPRSSPPGPPPSRSTIPPPGFDHGYAPIVDGLFASNGSGARPAPVHRASEGPPKVLSVPAPPAYVAPELSTARSDAPPTLSASPPAAEHAEALPSRTAEEPLPLLQPLPPFPPPTRATRSVAGPEANLLWIAIPALFVLGAVLGVSLALRRSPSQGSVARFSRVQAELTVWHAHAAPPTTTTTMPWAVAIPSAAVSESPPSDVSPVAPDSHPGPGGSAQKIPPQKTPTHAAPAVPRPRTDSASTGAPRKGEPPKKKEWWEKNL